ncbi:nucleotidyltransferase domain-containing protein [Neobacillus cucumis]|uniref:Nucleotidyltransferase domain-containing protein n=1 Tax=Neobacillus cucumis TaxID=1740721 RepID=A0A2N5HBE0_9BACI|nr:nucleotidyltransferase domain-containing protein [Neobacillus cucumis]PLS02835.1 hypothetical protein CVD27_16725 [Neobacillus cucumis]
MKEKILDELKQIEQQFEVKVCYAVEAGSRAWGTASKNSDYDVRFIYVHKKDWYLSIDQKRDVIELPINQQLDLHGWDIRKTLQLFRKSNPSLLEWVHSNHVYFQAFKLIEKMKDLEQYLFNPKSALFHYLNMAKGNLRNGLQAAPIISKQLLNIIRPILACMWIEKQNSFPPNELPFLIKELIREEELKQELLSLIERKINRDEPRYVLNLSILHKFMENQIKYLEEYANNLNVSPIDTTPLLNQLFREILDEVWSQ